MNLQNHVLTAALVVATMCLAEERAAATPVVFTALNEFGATAQGTWGAEEVMWVYTPTAAFGLVGIETKFGPTTDNPTVTVEIYATHPSAHPALDFGNLLGSATFTPVSNTFTGGFFSTVPLVAGEDYYIGFRHVEGLSVNYTNDAAAVQLTEFWGGTLDDGSYGFGPSGGGHCLVCDPPILRFYAEPIIPEPSSLLLLATGVLGVAAKRRLSNPLA